MLESTVYPGPVVGTMSDGGSEVFIFNTTWLGSGNINGSRANGNHFGRVRITIFTSHAITMKIYRSINGGTSWQQTQASVTIPATTANTTDDYDINVDAWPDVRIGFTPGVTAPTTITCSITGIAQRMVAN